MQSFERPHSDAVRDECARKDQDEYVKREHGDGDGDADDSDQQEAVSVTVRPALVT